MSRIHDKSIFRDCIVSIDYKGDCRLIDAPKIDLEKNFDKDGHYILKNDIFGLLNEMGEGSWLLEMKDKAQGIYKADITFNFLIFNEWDAVDYDYEMILENLIYIPI